MKLVIQAERKAHKAALEQQQAKFMQFLRLQGLPELEVSLEDALTNQQGMNMYPSVAKSLGYLFEKDGQGSKKASVAIPSPAPAPSGDNLSLIHI